MVQLHRLKLIRLLIVKWSLDITHRFCASLLLITYLSVIRVEETLVHALAAPVVWCVRSSNDRLFGELLICNLLNECFIWGILVQVELIFKHHVHLLFEFVNAILGLVSTSAYFHWIIFSNILLLIVPNTRLACWFTSLDFKTCGMVSMDLDQISNCRPMSLTWWWLTLRSGCCSSYNCVTYFIDNRLILIYKISTTFGLNSIWVIPNCSKSTTYSLPNRYSLIIWDRSLRLIGLLMSLLHESGR